MSAPDLPVLITTTHSSGHVPFDILAEMLGEAVYDPDKRAARLAHLFAEGDPYTDLIFHLPGAQHLSALTSRFVVDLNRRRDEGGLNGVIKVTDFGGHPLYPEGFRFDEGALERRLTRYYDPFHAAIERTLASGEVRFFIDGHAMTPRGPLIGPDQGRPRPAFAIITGGDTAGERVGKGHTSIPAELAQEVVRLLEHHFHDLVTATPGVPARYLINDPFAFGGIQEIYTDPRRPHATPGFSLEINHALYLQPTSRGGLEPIPGRIADLNARFQAFVRELIPAFERATLPA